LSFNFFIHNTDRPYHSVVADHHVSHLRLYTLAGGIAGRRQLHPPPTCESLEQLSGSQNIKAT